MEKASFDPKIIDQIMELLKRRNNPGPLVRQNIKQVRKWNDYENERLNILASDQIIKAIDAKEKKSQIDSQQRTQILTKMQRWEEFRKKREIAVKKYIRTRGCIVRC